MDHDNPGRFVRVGIEVLVFDIGRDIDEIALLPFELFGFFFPFPGKLDIEPSVSATFGTIAKKLPPFVDTCKFLTAVIPPPAHTMLGLAFEITAVWEEVMPPSLIQLLAMVF